MELINKKTELLANIDELKRYFQQPGPDRDFAHDLMRLGICFVVTEENAKLFFAPSRFIGYQDNRRHNHTHNGDRDGREPNAAIEPV